MWWLATITDRQQHMASELPPLFGIPVICEPFSSNLRTLPRLPNINISSLHLFPSCQAAFMRSHYFKTFIGFRLDHGEKKNIAKWRGKQTLCSLLHNLITWRNPVTVCVTLCKSSESTALLCQAASIHSNHSEYAWSADWTVVKVGHWLLGENESKMFYRTLRWSRLVQNNCDGTAASHVQVWLLITDLLPLLTSCLCNNTLLPPRTDKGFRGLSHLPANICRCWTSGEMTDVVFLLFLWEQSQKGQKCQPVISGLTAGTAGSSRRP